RYHYDFYFDNPSDTTVELGLADKSCRCSDVQVAFLSPAQAAALEGKLDHETLMRLLSKDLTWQTLVKDQQGVTVPGNAMGLVRVNWKVGVESLDLDVTLWMRAPEGTAQKVTLRTPTLVVPAVLFDQTPIKLGEITPAAAPQAGSPDPKPHAEFDCW